MLHVYIQHLNALLYCMTLFSGFAGRGLWLNSLLLEVSQPSVYGIFSSGCSGGQTNSLSGGAASFIDRLII
jgi:hypothetical protein